MSLTAGQVRESMVKLAGDELAESQRHQVAVAGLLRWRKGIEAACEHTDREDVPDAAGGPGRVRCRDCRADLTVRAGKWVVA